MTSMTFLHPPAIRRRHRRQMPQPQAPRLLLRHLLLRQRSPRQRLHSSTRIGMHDESGVQPTQTSVTLGQWQPTGLKIPSRRGHSVITVAIALSEHARGQHVKLHSTLPLQLDNIEEINLSLHNYWHQKATHQLYGGGAVPEARLDGPTCLDALPPTLVRQRRASARWFSMPTPSSARCNS